MRLWPGDLPQDTGVSYTHRHTHILTSTNEGEHYEHCRHAVENYLIFFHWMLFQWVVWCVSEGGGTWIRCLVWAWMMCDCVNFVLCSEDQVLQNFLKTYHMSTLWGFHLFFKTKSHLPLANKYRVSIRKVEDKCFCLLTSGLCHKQFVYWDNSPN